MNDLYDSTVDTLRHIRRVNTLLIRLVALLLERASFHDESKLHDPEKALFDRMTPQLSTLTYGSDEYHAALEELRPALEHHYAANAHHPECHEQGIDGMTLIDVLEMLVDWKAASERHADGDIQRSIEISCKRFGISDQLAQILRNTAPLFEDEP